MKRQAIIFGATGAVGRELLNLCLNGDRYQKVTVIARRAAPVAHDKLDWVEADFDNLNNLAPISGLVDGDAYCCLGTTIKAAGSQAMFRRVDFDYVLNAAKFSNKCAVTNFSMISAVGADQKSSSLYNKTKGEVEQAVMAEQLNALRILRPSLLKGEREEFRLKEVIGNLASLLLTPVFFFGLKKYQPIEIKKLARGLYNSVNEEIASGSVRIYESDEIQAY
jgi:uncharacterized protein YbjT (DUF2867 family)